MFKEEDIYLEIARDGFTCFWVFPDGFHANASIYKTKDEALKLHKKLLDNGDLEEI